MLSPASTLRLLLCLLSLALEAGAEPRYETRSRHDPNGTGIFYLGREIAQVMGHQAADWLERPERAEEEGTAQLLAALRLQPGETVADIGAGTGFLSEKMARAVGPKGRVYAEDIQPEMLALLERRKKQLGLENLQAVLGTTTDPKLPAASVDLILLVDVYHELDHPWEMTQNMLRALRPGGRLVLVEYRGEDPEVPIKLVHKMTEAQVRRELAAFPELRWEETIRSLPQQHILVFRRAP